MPSEGTASLAWARRCTSVPASSILHDAGSHDEAWGQESENRHAENVKRVYAQKLKRFAGPVPNQCSRCWHETKLCICPDETSPVAGLFPHRIIVYMHVKEFARGSNTSSLCQVAFPSNTTVLVASVPDNEVAFAQELARRPERTIVLYPTAESVTASDFLHNTRRQRADATLPTSSSCTAAGQGPEAEVEPLTIVLIDGTWGQARRLAKKLPAGLNCVRLDATSGENTMDIHYSSPLRQQPGPGRLCSVAALAVLTRQLGVDPRVEQYLLGLLRKKSDVFLAAHNKEWKGPSPGQSPRRGVAARSHQVE